MRPSDAPPKPKHPGQLRPQPRPADSRLQQSPSDVRMPNPISEPRPQKPPSDPREKVAEGRYGGPADPRLSTSRGASTPVIVRGEVPNEPTLVSIVTAQDALEYTHVFVAAYCKHRFRASIAEGLTVAAHELLENAINYGSVSNQVLFEIVERTGAAAVRVTNETIPARLEMLRQHVEKLAVNPEAVMLEEMKRSMGSSRIRPMLGLARVVQEAGLGLELYIVGSRVSVLARAST